MNRNKIDSADKQHGSQILPAETDRHEMPDRPKTPYEQRWDAMSDLQKMILQGLCEHYSNEYKETVDLPTTIITNKEWKH